MQVVKILSSLLVQSAGTRGSKWLIWPTQQQHKSKAVIFHNSSQGSQGKFLL